MTTVTDHQGCAGIEDLLAVADRARVELDDRGTCPDHGRPDCSGSGPVTSTVSSSWPPHAPMSHPPSNDETRGELVTPGYDGLPVPQ
jgi:hypothetical protein